MSKLHEAASTGNLELLEELIDSGVNVSDPDIDWGGRTPLHIASSYGHKKCVSALVKAGADLNAQTAAGWTPAHYVCETGSVDCLRCLLSAGCEIKCDWSGDTPLRIAEIYGHNECMELIRENRASVPGDDQAPPTKHSPTTNVDSTDNNVSNITEK